MAENLDSQMRYMAENLWRIGNELTKATAQQASLPGSDPDVGGTAWHDLKAAVDQFRHVLWSIEEATGTSGENSEATLLALRLRRSAEMLQLARSSLKDPKLATEKVLGLVGEIQSVVYELLEDAGQGALAAYRNSGIKFGRV